MAVLEVPFFPSAPSHIIQVALDGAQWRIRYDWSPPRSSWYLSLFTAAGETVYLRQRMTPTADLSRTLVFDGPPGLLGCSGPDPYGRFDLSVFYVPREDLVVAPRTDVRVTLQTELGVQVSNVQAL